MTDEREDQDREKRRWSARDRERRLAVVRGSYAIEPFEDPPLELAFDLFELEKKTCGLLEMSKTFRVCRG